MQFVWTRELLLRHRGDLLRLNTCHFATLRLEHNGVWAVYNRRLRPMVDGFVAGGDDSQMITSLNRLEAVPATTPMSFTDAVVGLGSLDTSIRFPGEMAPLTADDLLAHPPVPLDAQVELKFDVEQDRDWHVSGRMVLPNGKAIRFGPG